MPPYPPSLVHPNGEALTRVPGLALIGLSRSISMAEFWSRIHRVRGVRILGIEGEGSGKPKDHQVAGTQINNSTRRYWIEYDAEYEDRVQSEISGALGRDLDFFGPVYRPAESHEDAEEVEGGRFAGLVCPVPNVLVARVQKERDADFEAALARAHLDLEELTKHSAQTGRRLRHFRIPTPGVVSAFEARERLAAEVGDAASLHLQHVPVLRPGLINPNDPLHPQQWNLITINAPTAWDKTEGSPGTFIAIIDDGVMLKHPDLEQNVEDGVTINEPGATGDIVDPSVEWHGTIVAGIAAAATNNNVGISGLAGRCRIYPIKFDFSDVEFMAALYHAIEIAGAAVGRRMVVNLSFGWTTKQLRTLDVDGMDAAIVEAHGANLLLCAGTGNESQGRRAPPPILYPSRHPRVMACGGSDRNDYRCTVQRVGYDSQFGDLTYKGTLTGVSVVAPGLGIYGSLVDGWYGPRAGTSFATPHVAALGALVIAVNGTLNNDAVRAVIEKSATKVHQAGAPPLYAYANMPGFPHGTRHPEVGYGRIDAAAALRDAAAVVVAVAGANPG